MKLETLEALQAFVISVSHSLDHDHSLHIEASTLDSLLEDEINLKKKLNSVYSGSCEDFPEILKEQSGES